jgi:outer membrane protein insertion porin family
MKKIVILLFFILFSNFSLAEVVKKIEISGNDRISSETISVYGEIKLNTDYDKLGINKILKNLYSTNFFEDINISLENNVLKISVKEFPVINSVSVEGEKAKKVKDVILERINLTPSSSFVKSLLNDDIRIIKQLYAFQGFNFTQVEAKVEKFGKNRLNLIFIVDKGEKTKISKISFIGDKKIKERRLRDVIVSEEDKPWKFLTKNTNLNKSNIDLDIRLLTNYYKSIGYYDVAILSNNAEINKNNETELTYTINAGKRFTITKISTDVNPSLNKLNFIPLNENFKKVVGKYYSPFLVKTLLEDLDQLINDNDLQFVEHSVSEILEGDSIEVKINIYEGSKDLIERINIKGNTITNESVIRGMLLLDEGDPYNKLKLEKTIAKLKARNIFASVKENVTVGTANDLKVIDLTVEERATGEIAAGAGIGTGGASFAFDVSENNFLGEGIKVASSLSTSKDSLKGRISVSNPNHNYSGNELNYHLSSLSTDKISTSGYKNNIYSIGAGTRFEQYKDIYLAPSLTFSYDDLKVQSTASDAMKKQAGTFSDLNASYSIYLDKRDRSFMPTSGYTSGFTQSFPIYADSAYIENKYGVASYKSFSPNVIGAAKFYVGAINSLGDDDIRLNKRLSLPSGKLRGFEKGKVGPRDGEDYVGGNYVSAINFEASLPNALPESTKTEVQLFFDLGNVWGVDYSSSIDDSNKVRATTGVNTSWLSPIGPMTFVFSQNLLKASTDVTETFNFRLGTTF